MLLVVAASITVVATSVWLVGRHRIRTAVEAGSAALKALQTLNSSFRPRLISYAPITRNFFDQVNTKPKFDRYDLAEFLYQCLDQNEMVLAGEIEQRRGAMRAYSEYEAERMRLQTTLLGTSGFGSLDADRCRRVEARLFERQRLRYPPPAAQVVCGVGYVSPQGRNSYQKSLTLSFGELEAALESMRATRSERSTAAQQRRNERAKMTASIRVDVLRRDGFRCKFCGADSSVAELHVDHIVPVSKGGLTELGNLQTLCADCNQGKSNRFID